MLLSPLPDFFFAFSSDGVELALKILWGGVPIKFSGPKSTRTVTRAFSRPRGSQTALGAPIVLWGAGERRH